MAATSWSRTAALEDALLPQGEEFSFFQAMRLLAILAKADAIGGKPADVRIRPELSLAFPAADVAGIERDGDSYRLTATFLGLYGPASPLPTFYTEELLDEAANDSSTSREFLDIVNHRLFTLFHHCSVKYRLFHQVAEGGHEELLERLFCLIGLGEPVMRRSFPDPKSLLRHSPLLVQNSRSALGLKTLLAHDLGLPVQVSQCLPRRVSVPADQRLSLGVSGSSLGMDTVIGSEITDVTGKFRVHVGPLARAEFDTLLPGMPGRQQLDRLVGLYVNEPLAWDVELVLAPGAGPVAILGTPAGSRLGWDTWLGVGDPSVTPSVVFPGQAC